MKEIYEVAAKAAYTNCLELLDEANILYSHSKFPRAYALCILSTEELAKSYFYKCLSTGMNPNNESSRGLTNHDKKIFRAFNLLLNVYIFSQCGTDIFNAIQHDKQQSDHQNPLAPSVIKESVIRGMKSEPVTRIFLGAQDRKLKALYVDVLDGHLSVPSEVIGVKQCKEILDFMNESFHGFDIMWKCDDETFRKIIKWLDPMLSRGHSINPLFFLFTQRTSGNSRIL